MSYVKGTLSKDEEIKEIAKFHWINFVMIYVNAFFCLILFALYYSEKINMWFMLFWTAITLIGWLDLYTTEMVVTNKRVICKKGFISVDTEEIKNAKIESVEIKQSFFGRIFKYGTIYFSGTGTSKVKFRAIDNPWAIKSKIETIIGD